MVEIKKIYTPDTETLRGPMKPIESTGNILTIPQRERDARRHIIDVLATNEQRLWTLNEQEAARHVQAAIDTLKTTILNRNPKEETHGTRT